MRGPHFPSTPLSSPGVTKVSTHPAALLLGTFILM